MNAFFEKVAVNEAKGTVVYFLGIGGIGMSAIARYFNSKGLKVKGYDKTETLLTKKMVEEGIEIHFEDNVNLIDKELAFVVYTPAIPTNHQEYNYLLNNGYLIFKRSEVLGMITRNTMNICVAGTHGKTTTSSMIAHILTHSGYGCNAFLGGITANYNTNFLSSTNNVCVVEADEYDRSFLKLNPDIAVITAMDPDHLDIYENEENFRSAFVEFSSKIKSSGFLFIKKGLEKNNDFACGNSKTYSVDSKNSDVFIQNLTIQNGAYQFDVCIDNIVIDGFVLNMGGMHNVENALVSIAVAKLLNIETYKIKEAVASFKGVKRRFEYVIRNNDCIMIDDYAHHPQELEALISGSKKLYPEKKCVMVFQPHLYSRTRDFATGFAQALNLADEIFILPIYPARELPITGVTSNMIASLMPAEKVKCLEKEELLKNIKERKKTELLIIAGAGDIDLLVEPIKNLLN
jgi:UDP-N-acetylmuramate--alanine ligase